METSHPRTRRGSETGEASGERRLTGGEGAGGAREHAVVLLLHGFFVCNQNLRLETKREEEGEGEEGDEDKKGRRTGLDDPRIE